MNNSHRHFFDAQKESQRRLLFSCSVLSLQPHGLKHTRHSCPSVSPRVCSNSCPLSWWCHPLILRHPLLLTLSIFSSIRIFSSESAFCIKWLKYWSFSFSISPSHEYSGMISFRMDWLDLLAVLMTTTALHYCRSKSGEEWGRSGWTVLEQGKVLKGTWSFNKGVQDMIDMCKQFFM